MQDDQLYDGISEEYHVDINTKTAGTISTIVTCEQDNIDIVVGSRKNFTVLSIDKTYGDKAFIKLNKKSTNLAWVGSFEQFHFSSKKEHNLWKTMLYYLIF